VYDSRTILTSRIAAVKEDSMARVTASRAWFGEALRAARESRLLTRAQLAQRLGASPSTVANAERGHRTPPYKDLGKWAVALGMEDGGEALQKAYRFSQGFLERAVSGPGSEQPFWDETFTMRAGKLRVDLQEIHTEFGLPDMDAELTKSHDRLVRILFTYNFVKVMEDLTPHKTCSFGPVLTGTESGVPVGVILVPHGGDQIVVLPPDFDDLADEFIAEQTPRPRSQHQSTVRVPDGLLDGLTQSDLTVIKAVADGLRRARGAD
jgi:transcriptional regulator with XRE-family HTH domain